MWDSTVHTYILESMELGDGFLSFARNSSQPLFPHWFFSWKSVASNLQNNTVSLCQYCIMESHSSRNFSWQLKDMWFQWNFSNFPKKSSSLRISLVFLSFSLVYSSWPVLVFTMNVGYNSCQPSSLHSELQQCSQRPWFSVASLAVTEFSFDFNISKCSWVIFS